MAIKRLVMTCDQCEYEDEDLESMDEANEMGWYVLQGPERDLGRQELVFCGRECLLAYL